MKKKTVLLIVLYISVLSFAGYTQEGQTSERLDRGVIALPTGPGTMYIGWRLLQSDPKNVGFNVYRIVAGEDVEYQKVNERPIKSSTNFIDKTVIPGQPYRYIVKVLINGEEIDCLGMGYARALKFNRFYLSIPMKGNYTPKRVAIADLDGDGAYDYVIQQPATNIDPAADRARRASPESTPDSVVYHYGLGWVGSKEPYKLEAYSSKGKFMWRYDMGWAIESGTWYAPYVVYDVDGDGYAEVYTKAGAGDPREPYGAVVEGPEYLVKLDGRSGEVVDQTDWVDRTGYSIYNRYSRNYLAIAYLNGKDPSVVLSRGTYDLIKTAAYDKNLEQVWYWESTGEYNDYRGQAEHGLTAVDVDGDGRDELILGAAALNDDGTGLWTTGTGHGNVCKVADIDPNNPGFEVFKGRETKTESENGLCLVSAKDGSILWCYEKPRTKGVASGMIGDFDPKYPGMECYAVENNLDTLWFYTAHGEPIPPKNIKTKQVQPVWWDSDVQKELVDNGEIFKYDGGVLGEIEGEIIAIADVLGDWREEIITSLEGEIRIYSTTIPTDTARPCLMQDRLYRTNVAAFFPMGYFRVPELGGYPMPTADQNAGD